MKKQNKIKLLDKFNKNNKTQISVQTFFFIFMSILMVAIIIYGLKQIFFVQETLSEQDRVLFQKDLEKVFNNCKDPLNKGNKFTINLNNNLFNSVCISNGEDFNSNPNLNDELNIIKNTGDNIILLNVDIDSNSNIISSNIISSFKIDVDSINETKCFLPDISGKSNIVITC